MNPFSIVLSRLAIPPDTSNVKAALALAVLNSLRLLHDAEPIEYVGDPVAEVLWRLAHVIGTTDSPAYAAIVSIFATSGIHVADHPVPTGIGSLREAKDKLKEEWRIESARFAAAALADERQRNEQRLERERAASRKQAEELVAADEAKARAAAVEAKLAELKTA